MLFEIHCNGLKTPLVVVQLIPPHHCSFDCNNIVFIYSIHHSRHCESTKYHSFDEGLPVSYYSTSMQRKCSIARRIIIIKLSPILRMGLKGIHTRSVAQRRQTWLAQCSLYVWGSNLENCTFCKRPPPTHTKLCKPVSVWPCVGPTQKMFPFCSSFGLAP